MSGAALRGENMQGGLGSTLQNTASTNAFLIDSSAASPLAWREDCIRSDSDTLEKIAFPHSKMSDIDGWKRIHAQVEIEIPVSSA